MARCDSALSQHDSSRTMCVHGFTEMPPKCINALVAFWVLGRMRHHARLAKGQTGRDGFDRLFRNNQNERIVMFKHFRALGIAGLTTLSASQLVLAGPDSVLWSQNKETY